MGFGISKKSLALNPVDNKPVEHYRHLKLDVRRLVVSIFSQICLVAEGQLELSCLAIQSNLILLSNRPIKGIKQL